MFQKATSDEVSVHYFNSETGQSMEWCDPRIRLSQPSWLVRPRIQH